VRYEDTRRKEDVGGWCRGYKGWGAWSCGVEARQVCREKGELEAQ